MSKPNIWDFWAAHYDRLWVQRVSLGPTREHLGAQLAQRTPGRLLDMGCGTGQLCAQLTGWSYHGVDASSAMIAEARRHHPAAHFTCADLLAFAAPAASFDAVVCAHAFPYVSDKTAALARLAGWLRPGGCLLLAQACTETVYDRLILSVVKLTTTPARYLPVAELCALARPILGEPRAVVRINRHRGVPSLRLLVWEKPAPGGAP